MQLTKWLRERYIYIFVLALFALVGIVIYIYQIGGMNVEAAKMYLQALTALATLALLYYAYFNVSSKREEDIAHLELAVRPVLVWELESSDGSAQLSYKAIRHPIYDLRILIRLDGQLLRIDEPHLDVFEQNAAAGRKVGVSDFILKGLGGKKDGLLEFEFAYHSEVGGRYVYNFTKEVVKKPKGFSIQHRKIISAKYPWRNDEVRFED